MTKFAFCMHLSVVQQVSRERRELMKQALEEVPNYNSLELILVTVT